LEDLELDFGNDEGLLSMLRARDKK
jgi:hypothetical protein